MASLTPTAFDYALKTRYTEDDIKNMVYKDQPLLAMIPKDEGFRGKNKVIPVKYTNIAGRSADFSLAQANKAASKGKAFTLTRVKDYGLASVDNETIEASQGDANAFMEGVEEEMNSAIDAIKRSLGQALYGDGSGEIGSISSIAANVITLVSADDVTNFEEGMNLVFASSTAAALRDNGTSAAVTAVDRDAGTVTIGSTPTGTVANDEIFMEGDYKAASDRLKVSGLKAWIPDSAPGSTAFFGVDRSVDTTRLGGVRVDGAGLPLTEALTKAATRISREGGRPSHAFMSFDRYEELINLLGSKVQYTDFEVGTIGFAGIKLHSPKGMVKVFPDLNAPANHCYMVQLDTLKLYSLGPAPHILNYNGTRYYHEATADGIEVRVGFYGNVATCAPGWNGVITNFGA